MTVKNAQAKLNLAYIIEDKLGYPVVKSDSRRLGLGDEHSYTGHNANQSAFKIKSQYSVLKRALKRQQLQKIQRQKNIEAILCEAMRVCPEVTSQGMPDSDWVDRFIQLAEDTSNSQMQMLWAKILVGETLAPGTFSMKSLQTLKQMTQREADALNRAASLCGYLEKEDSNVILLGYFRRPSFFDLLRKGNKETINLSKTGLSFPHILTLMDINLLYRQEIESAELKAEQALQFRFHKQRLSLTAKHSDLVLYYYKLTQTGDELKKLVSSPINKNYKQALEQVFSEEFVLQWDE